MLSTRISAVRRGVAVASRRMYSEGSVGGGSPGFNKKEKAHEDQYARQQEQAALKKLRDSIAEAKQHLETLQKHAEEAEKKVQK
ncbi:hypothetical protein SISNIDRAFT_452040 [Sistotremastrum niveocremeum HHB9708]|uniref:ATPase inhibitor, mitochondrial n=2 Tax=Sistotremastraceae TaxID=3402574 RepID=A0A164WWY4_9AGAM|nr:hypothetical protein SISNIDRAFT_452040 [Sistotremastrum niveocremeum HHB9708]KZT39782.1 hypothetical protein SISSUDRAFT_1045100 [Sistotremastrum suecicum HHB10207 ss-3]